MAKEALPLLSVLIPAYNEEDRIGLTIQQTSTYLRKRNISFEILVVDDGSIDNTQSVVREMSKSNPDIKLLPLSSNKGKGAATKRGIFSARGEYILTCDADLSVPIEEVGKFLRQVKDGVDIAFASRFLPESRIEKFQPILRRITGAIFRLIVRAFIVDKFSDTQCGFKCFKRAVAYNLFKNQKLNGFSFDVEILLMASKNNYCIKEVPVIWSHVDGSKVRPVRDFFQMIYEIFLIH